jgi:hypothetical protein
MDPIDYNNYLSSMTDSLYSKGEKWGTKFAAIKAGDRDFSKLKIYRKNISEFIILNKAEIKRMEPVGKSGEDLKHAVLSFMEYELEMIETAFMPIENLNASSTETEFQNAMNKLINESDREGDYVKMIRTAQSIYARDNGFTLDRDEEE